MREYLGAAGCRFHAGRFDHFLQRSKQGRMNKPPIGLLVLLVASCGTAAVAQTAAPQSLSSLDATVAGLESTGLFIPDSRLVNPDGTLRKHGLSADPEARRFH